MKKLIISNTYDPYFNLAAEEYLVRNFNNEQIIAFIYINEPVVVMGKNQNVFEEVNIEALRNSNVKLARRISGGGTVYHDLQNLNFSFVTKYDSKLFNKYLYFNKPIVDSLNKLGVDAVFNKRNDIVIGDLKISGNAQFTTKNSMLSHGTLLFDSDLKNVSHFLKPNWKSIKSRSSKSTRSKVVNIKKYLNQNASFNEFKNIICQGLIDYYDNLEIREFSKYEFEKITMLANEKYESFEWITGRSPDCIIMNEIKKGGSLIKANVHISKGVIDKIESEEINKNLLDKMNVEFAGSQFEIDSLTDKIKNFNCTDFTMDDLEALIYCNE